MWLTDHAERPHRKLQIKFGSCRTYSHNWTTCKLTSFWHSPMPSTELPVHERLPIGKHQLLAGELLFFSIQHYLCSLWQTAALALAVFFLTSLAVVQCHCLHCLHSHRLLPVLLTWWTVWVLTHGAHCICLGEAQCVIFKYAVAFEWQFISICIYYIYIACIW